MHELPDLSIPETREFWTAVFLAVLARPGTIGPSEAVVQAKFAADDACAALVKRVAPYGT